MAFLFDLTWDGLIAISRDIDTFADKAERSKTCMLDITVKLTNVRLGDNVDLNPSIDIGNVYNDMACGSLQRCNGPLISHDENACLTESSNGSKVCVTNLSHRNCSPDWAKIFAYIILPIVLGGLVIAFFVLWMMQVPIPKIK